MKPIVFTKHAFKRIDQRTNIRKYAEKVFRDAELVHKAKEVDYYRNGRFRFIAKEDNNQIKVITVIKD